ncbi:MAG: hypothetical protein A2087_14600 [Spirochaetes bacterium GWD1_61_31]|nr:MAG: hypothetical protein A2Y37_06695 [Spirochaetes bacterium GWB1_60_80]OHD30763.1 MAG: hypothetical protein A2004_04220 [Spirochaetes bacterium GWC1_61_12]OHD37249.1 MAG: hypothetical protein A2087_14600 [Spirochaetes bacterium GWD1_61_31]OHD46262.1 MAG: hypothetical protein A2Y35_06970 [Spirochaetes bacterium GWE1_60_18]OHD60869.1 MAG: hypothetical protein A2Y32_11715 [Spirochaetes bacterium GWF1_60_12]HAP42874.1 hypothetical protein [Spirochaetaceae bacterium]
MKKTGTASQASAGKVPAAAAGPQANVLTVRLTSLPDISSLSDVEEHGYLFYGRFAVTRDGKFWFADALSTHPVNTEIGWYWALATNGELLVSARGVALEGESLFHGHKASLARLIHELAQHDYIKEPTGIRMIT